MHEQSATACTIADLSVTIGPLRKPFAEALIVRFKLLCFEMLATHCCMFRPGRFRNVVSETPSEMRSISPFS